MSGPTPGRTAGARVHARWITGLPAGRPCRAGGDLRAAFGRPRCRRSLIAGRACCRSPLTAEDRGARLPHELAFRQAELSDTRVFDRPEAGRAWFERSCRDQLTLGRPDQVALVFSPTVISDTPGRFQTRVINRGVEPSIQVHYRLSKVKQYFKEGRALRTETTVNDTRDFGIGRLLTEANWQALVSVRRADKRAASSTPASACACAPDATTLARVVLPSTKTAYPPPPCASATRARKRCSQPLQLQPPVQRPQQPHTARAGLRPHPRLQPRQMTYDLRRLRRKGCSSGSPEPGATSSPATDAASPSSSPRPTPGSSTPHSPNSTPRSRRHRRRAPLARAWHAYERALNQRINDAAIAA